MNSTVQLYRSILAFYKKKYPEKRQLERQIAKFDINDPQWTFQEMSEDNLQHSKKMIHNTNL